MGLIILVFLVYFLFVIISKLTDKSLKSTYGTVIEKRTDNDIYYVKFKVGSEIKEFKIYIKMIYDRLNIGMVGSILYKDNIIENFIENQK
ncbi:MAG: hypothetical protein IJ463_07870 [Bacilli bacterium]|nr:hypothetical protein [Bacilli bacterium]